MLVVSTKMVPVSKEMLVVSTGMLPVSTAMVVVEVLSSGGTGFKEGAVCVVGTF